MRDRDITILKQTNIAVHYPQQPVTAVASFLSSRLAPLHYPPDGTNPKGYGFRRGRTHSFSASPNGSHEKINAPRNAPMNIQMIMYPLKYIASNMMKYATANCSMCSSARISCSMSVGRIIPASLDGTGAETATGGFGVVVFVSCWF